jgi:hypothetical protein
MQLPQGQDAAGQSVPRLRRRQRAPRGQAVRMGALRLCSTHRDPCREPMVAPGLALRQAARRVAYPRG